MLVDALLSYLTRNVTDAKLSTYKELLPFLYQLDPGTFENQLNQFTTYLDEFTTVDNIAQFDHTICVLISEGIEEFGFYLSDDLSLVDRLSLLSKICQALYGVDQYEDLLSIKVALETSEGNREKIADILRLVDNSIEPHAVLEICKEISPALIYRIRDTLNDLEYQFDIEPTEDNAAAVERVKIALDYYGIQRAVRFFREGGKIGEDISNYLDFFYSDIKGVDSTSLAKLAVFSGIAAGFENKDIKEILSDLLPQYFVDPIELMSISRAVLKLTLPENPNAQA